MTVVRTEQDRLPDEAGFQIHRADFGNSFGGRVHIGLTPNLVHIVFYIWIIILSSFSHRIPREGQFPSV